MSSRETTSVSAERSSGLAEKGARGGKEEGGKRWDGGEKKKKKRRGGGKEIRQKGEQEYLKDPGEEGGHRQQ